jgi:hypothetical protein
MSKSTAVRVTVPAKARAAQRVKGLRRDASECKPLFDRFVHVASKGKTVKESERMAEARR